MAVSGLAAGTQSAAAAEPRRAKASSKKTYVLVHGAWHGGWCWKHVTPLLRAAGHDVYVPTLTGLGEKAHLMSPAVNLSTHVTDVAELFELEEAVGRDPGWPLLRRPCHSAGGRSRQAAIAPSGVCRCDHGGGRQTVPGAERGRGARQDRRGRISAGSTGGGFLWCADGSPGSRLGEAPPHAASAADADGDGAFSQRRPGRFAENLHPLSAAPRDG